MVRAWGRLDDGWLPNAGLDFLGSVVLRTFPLQLLARVRPRNRAVLLNQPGRIFAQAVAWSAATLCLVLVPIGLGASLLALVGPADSATSVVLTAIGDALIGHPRS